MRGKEGLSSRCVGRPTRTSLHAHVDSYEAVGHAVWFDQLETIRATSEALNAMGQGGGS